MTGATPSGRTRRPRSFGPRDSRRHFRWTVVVARSYLARDRWLHDHVRGLVAMCPGRWADAALGGRGARVPTRALGATGGMGLYAPRSDLDYWMARAFAAAALPDSARLHSAYVRRAWATGDHRERQRLLALPVR